MYLNIYESIFDANSPNARRPADNRPMAIGRVLAALSETAYHEAVLWRPLERELSRVWFAGAGRVADDRGVLVVLHTWWYPADYGGRLVRFRGVLRPCHWGVSWADAARRRARDGVRAGRWTSEGDACVARPPDTLREPVDQGWIDRESDLFVTPDGAGEAPGVVERVRTFMASGAAGAATTR